MSSTLQNNIDLVGGILTERFGAKSKLFNDPITTLQICQHIIKIGIQDSDFLHPAKWTARNLGKEIFQALNLYSSGHPADARAQVEKVIDQIRNFGPTIDWPTAAKKGFAKFAKNFPAAFEKSSQEQAQAVLDDFAAALQDDKDRPNVHALKVTVQDLDSAVKEWDAKKIEDTFYSLIDYYNMDESKVRPSLVTT